MRLYTSADGLGVSSCRSIYQDTLGYLWIGTGHGLSRFDGKQFNNYSNNLLGQGVEVKLKDTKNRLWLTTRDAILQFQGNKFIQYPIENSTRRVQYIFQIAETPDGEIWAMTDAGVFGFDETRWKRLSLFPGSDDMHCRGVIWHNGEMYINYGTTIVVKERNGGWKQLTKEANDYPHYNLMLKAQGDVYVNTRTEVFKVTNSGMLPVFTDLKSLRHFTYFIDSKKRLWHFQPEGQFIHVSLPGQFNSPHFQLPNEYIIILKIIEDSNGTFWAGTQEGLLKIREVAYKRIHGRDNPIGKASSAFPVSDSTLLLNLGDDLAFFDIRFPYDLKILWRTTTYDDIDASAADEKGRVWMITRNRKLLRLEGNTIRDFSHLLPKVDKSVFLYLAYDKIRKNLYVAIDSTVMRGDENKLEILCPVNTKKPVPFCTKILVTENGRILFLLPEYGIYHFTGDRLNNFSRETNLSKLHGVYQGNGAIWVCDSQQGLFQYKETDSLLELVNNISSEDGLQSNFIYSVATDKFNRIWLATSTGIDILINSNGKPKVYNYSKTAGLETNWFESKLFTDSTGSVWIFSRLDVIKFPANQVHLRHERPRISIDEVRLNSKEVDWRKITDSISSSTQLPYFPKIRYADNTVNIFYSGISFSDVPRLVYSYQLFPLENQWSSLISTNAVSFVNLPPGRYRFFVKVKDEASPWSDIAEFSFIILAPFWMQWWFITMSFLLLSLIVYGIYRIRLNQVKKMMAIRTRISRNLHDDIGSTLTSINILSKVSLRHLDNIPKTSSLLSKISEQSESIQQSMSDIVWSIAPANDKIENFAARMREYLAQVAEEKFSRVELNVDEKILGRSISMVYRQNLFLIFKEAVNNSVKYSNGTYLRVDLTREHNHIKLSVADDGSGFNLDNHTTTNGIRNMQFRAGEMNAVLQIETTVGKGTIIEVLLPAT